MPVSTTACLVFELLGAAFALKFSSVIHWGNSGKVVLGIIVSILRRSPGTTADDLAELKG